MSGDLASLVSRLEAVTSRLENVAGGKGGGAPSAGTTSKRLEALAVRLEAVADRKRGRGGASGDVDAMDFVDEYKTTVLKGKLTKYFELSAKLGGDIAKHAEIVKSAFQVQDTFIENAGTHKAPPPAMLQGVLKSTEQKVAEVQSFCEKNRTSKVFNHLMTVKEGIGCLGWIAVAPKPAPYVKEMGDQALFYGNRVIKEYRGKNDEHVEWMRAFTGAIRELQEYVKMFHPTGLAWNPDGSTISASSAPPPPPGPGAPPPPPPPVVAPTDAPTPSSGGKEESRHALLSDLSKGADVTKGLRKVTNDMKTYKNPALKASSLVKGSDVKPAVKTTPKYGAAAAVKKPPKLELQGKKWIVEYQEGQSGLQISETNPKQAIYVFRCTGSTLVVKGKCNSIILDNCKKMALVFEDVISSCEVINSQSVQVQVSGKCPTVSIDKTDGCQVFLSKQSLSCEIITAKSSEMNICIPHDSGDYSEHAITEQYKTVWNGKTLVTECSDINQ